LAGGKHSLAGGKHSLAGGKHSLAGSAWFRVDIGRAKGADPKWLLPMICRAGGLTKADIGTIRVFDHETKFEVSAEAADKFTADIKKRVGETPRIEPLGSAREGGLAAKVGGKPDKRTRQARKAQYEG
jgi:ATP-dependent RNA helicase DeaD